MAGILGSSWFYWSVGIAIGLPVAMIVLTEWQQSLRRKGSYLARPVALLRNYVLPLCALVLLMVEVKRIPMEATSTKVVGTLLAFMVMVLLLSGVNASLFQAAPAGTWRKRIPAIFVDVARLLLIAIGLGFIFANIWGADLQGLFTALGVTSIVVGLMLQNSVGQVISGLLVLFEQPFEIGDWLQTEDALGEVVEVNWRSVHLETDSGLQITPNSALAEASFTNLSRPLGKHKLKLVSIFLIDDRPDKVCAMLARVAAELPQCDPNYAPYAIPLGGLEYRTSIRLRSAADYTRAKATFLRWIWYASRREGLHLDEAEDILPTAEEIADAVRQVVAPILRLSREEEEELGDARMAGTVRCRRAHPALRRSSRDDDVHRRGPGATHRERQRRPRGAGRRTGSGFLPRADPAHPPTGDRLGVCRRRSHRRAGRPGRLGNGGIPKPHSAPGVRSDHRRAPRKRVSHPG